MRCPWTGLPCRCTRESLKRVGCTGEAEKILEFLGPLTSKRTERGRLIVKFRRQLDKYSSKPEGT